MIFGRRKKDSAKAETGRTKAADERDELDDDIDDTELDADVDTTQADDATDTDEADDSDYSDADDSDEDDSAEDDSADEDDSEEVTETDRWAELDESRDWREDGPFDIDEVDLEVDETPRLDFGSLIITPPEGAELQLQVMQETQQIVSALLVVGESALELSAYAAPRTPGMWTEVREEIISQTVAAGGTADCIEGPFGTELVRNSPVQTPDGQLAIQPSRTWVAQGPRWLLRGVLFGKAALTDATDDEVVGPLFDAFCDVIVRRGDNPMPVGDVLVLTLPEEMQADLEAQSQAQG